MPSLARSAFATLPPSGDEYAPAVVAHTTPFQIGLQTLPVANPWGGSCLVELCRWPLLAAEPSQSPMAVILVTGLSRTQWLGLDVASILGQRSVGHRLGLASNRQSPCH